MKINDLKFQFHAALDAIYGADEVSSIFYLCTEFYFNLSRLQIALQPDFKVDEHHQNIFSEILKELESQKPIQYILGETEFYGLTFKVNSHTLIPRQETEELIAWIAAQQQSTISVLDIGTGTGCIAISLAKEIKNAKIYALDVSDNAITVAKENAKTNAVDVTFIKADILDKTHHSKLISDSQKLDVIVSNPPYVRQLEKEEIKTNVLDYEPHLALFVEDDNPLQFYKAIAGFAIQNLKPDGELYFEINQYLGQETKQLLIDMGFVDVELRQDINGNDRMLKGVKQ